MVGQTRLSNLFRPAGAGKAPLSEPRITLAIPNKPNLDEKIQIQVYYR
jgi:hypothetical protein